MSINISDRTKQWNKIPKALSLLNIVCKRDNQLILSLLHDTPSATVNTIEAATGLAKRPILLRLKELQQVGLIISKEQQGLETQFYLNRHLYLKIHLASIAFA